MPREIPGFYYDESVGRYFQLSNRPAGESQERYSQDSIREREAAAERKAETKKQNKKLFKEKNKKRRNRETLPAWQRVLELAVDQERIEMADELWLRGLPDSSWSEDREAARTPYFEEAMDRLDFQQIDLREPIMISFLPRRAYDSFYQTDDALYLCNVVGREPSMMTTVTLKTLSPTDTDGHNHDDSFVRWQRQLAHNWQAPANHLLDSETAVYWLVPNPYPHRSDPHRSDFLWNGLSRQMLIRRSLHSFDDFADYRDVANVRSVLQGKEVTSRDICKITSAGWIVVFGCLAQEARVATVIYPEQFRGTRLIVPEDADITCVETSTDRCIYLGTRGGKIFSWKIGQTGSVLDGPYETDLGPGASVAQMYAFDGLLLVCALADTLHLYSLTEGGTQLELRIKYSDYKSLYSIGPRFRIAGRSKRYFMIADDPEGILRLYSLRSAKPIKFTKKDIHVEEFNRWDIFENVLYTMKTNKFCAR